MWIRIRARSEADAGRRPRFIPRRFGLALAPFLAWGLLGFVDVANWTSPVHTVCNALPAPDPDPELRPSEPSVVVLQHGLSGSRWSLWRLERSLEAQGFTVWNWSYDSTEGSIEQHAATLAERLERAFREFEVPPRLSFVGHSMGGLVIRAYLSRPDARPAYRCVFVGTPQRGAHLAALRIHDWSYGFVLGREGAPRELVPGEPIYQRLKRIEDPEVGVLAGGLGDGVGFSDEIPGDDDRRVALDEAQLPEQDAFLQVRLGHFSLAFDRRAIVPIRHFLARGRFPD